MTEDIRVIPDEELDIDIDIEVDAVCGAVLEPDDALAHAQSLEYEGRLYLFCGADCRAAFEREPTRYAAAGRSEP